VTVIAAVLTLISAASLPAPRPPWAFNEVPARVTGVTEMANRFIPGWTRAKAQGLVVDLGLTQTIPGTDSSITFEQGWFSGREAYITYTVKAPKGGYLMPTWVLVGPEGNEARARVGQTDWGNLSHWGGFSREGFHSVLVFEPFPDFTSAETLQLTVRQWAPVTPSEGLIQSQNPGREISLVFPWKPAYLQEPAPEVVPWPRQQTWLGRTLTLEQLEVGVGRIRLTGQIALPEGEHTPRLSSRLHVGDQLLEMKQFQAEAAATPGFSRFTATFDGPNQWPAPVHLELNGLFFETDQTLTWPVHWAKYRHLDGSERQLMDPADQVTVRFYDSDLVSIFTTDSGVAIEQKDPTGPPPYVRAFIAVGGRGRENNPGFEVVNTGGAVLPDLGGGGGHIYDNGHGNDSREGIAVMWWKELPEGFRQSEWLLIRYVHPGAAMVLNETWDLPAAAPR
jgi:hypothetical protein